MILLNRIQDVVDKIFNDFQLFEDLTFRCLVFRCIVQPQKSRTQNILLPGHRAQIKESGSKTASYAREWGF